jgi:hypothetical protein
MLHARCPFEPPKDRGSAQKHIGLLSVSGASGKEKEGLTVGATATETRACSAGRRKANETRDVVIVSWDTGLSYQKSLLREIIIYTVDEAEVRGKGKVRSVLGSRTLFPLLSHPTYPSRWSSES